MLVNFGDGSAVGMRWQKQNKNELDTFKRECARDCDGRKQTGKERDKTMAANGSQTCYCMITSKTRSVEGCEM
jgi:hypothetical protein